MLTIKTAGFEEYLDSANGAWIKCLILGEHGVGKTPSAARWPNPIIADCEHGVMSVASLGTPYATIENSKDMDELLDFLRRDSMKPAEKRQYQTLVIDTVDSYQRALISERLRNERKESLSGWADWGWLAGKGSQLVEKLLNLPMNVVVNMHVKDKRDDDGESSTLIKDNTLKGDLGETIYRDFDLIGLMEKSYVTESGERVLKRQIRWHSEPKVPMLRDRSGKLPRFTDIDFTENDYGRIFGAITEGLDQLPASSTLEEIGEPEQEAEVVPPTPGGPVGNVSAPRAPAKKTAAKKAAAKKTAAKQEPTSAVEVQEPGTPVDGAEDPWTPEATESEGKPEEPEEVAPEEAAKALVEDKLGASEVVADEELSAVKEQFPEQAQGASPACGTVSPGMKGDPSLGCGEVLTAQNAVKRQMAQLRTKTLLCDSCFEAWKTSN